MNVQVPDLKVDVMPTEEFFLRQWALMESSRDAIRIMLDPGLDAIKKFHFSRGNPTIFLNDFDLHVNGDGSKSIAYALTEHIHGNNLETTFVIPLQSILHGETAVIEFFQEELRKQEEKANAMGQKRMAKEKEDRRRQFQELKLEFEPPTEAIIRQGE